MTLERRRNLIHELAALARCPRTVVAGTHVAAIEHMAKPKKPKSESPEREEAPAGRETPSLGPPNARRKVQPLEGEPAMDRPYDPGGDKRAPDDPWQDPGGPEPANG